MRISPKILLLGLGLSQGFTCLPAVEPGQRLTQEELVERRTEAMERNKRLQPAAPVSDQSHPSQASILDTSVILTSSRNWTFVPKGAVLVVPEAYQAQVDKAPKGEFMHFNDFLKRNRGWLATLSVSLEQARGKAPVKAETREALVKGGRVVVTVCKGGPVASRQYVEAGATAKN